MPNKSHFNNGHIAMNLLAKNGAKHSSAVAACHVAKTYHALYIKDAVEFLNSVPDNSVQLVLVDPPYNLDLELWDSFTDYLSWAKQWLDHIYRILTDSGNCVIFGGFLFQDLKQGDLLEILHYARHNTDLRIVNLIIWYYKNGMSSHRFFANRHEEAVWLSKTKHYYFDLDSVRVPYSEEAKKAALKDKRLVPENVEKGKNPTNVWEIGRLNGNSAERVGHPTQKPLRLLYRIILASTKIDETILDPFAGSCTTGIAANLLDRKFIGIDQSEEFLNLGIRRKNEIGNPVRAIELQKLMSANPEETMVLVNHARRETRVKMIETGICYLRAGESQGSLCITPGFERMEYVLLHTSGQNSKLFRLKQKGCFQIWTKETLESYGFKPSHAAYYVVLKFDKDYDVGIKIQDNLSERINTYRVKVRPLSDFI